QRIVEAARSAVRSARIQSGICRRIRSGLRGDRPWIQDAVGGGGAGERRARRRGKSGASGARRKRARERGPAIFIVGLTRLALVAIDLGVPLAVCARQRHAEAIVEPLVGQQRGHARIVGLAVFVVRVLHRERDLGALVVG